MDQFRYFLGVLVVIAIPPTIVWWYVVHPLVDFWRGVGVRLTLTVVGVILVGGMAGLFLVREPLMGRDLGTNWVFVGIAAWLAVFAIWIAVERRRHLTMRIQLGVPELEAGGKGGKLLTEGVYAIIRNPRYVEIIVGTLAYALFANWSGPYMVTALSVLALHGIVLLEERELAERFGDEYLAYNARVPRYVPKLRKS